MATKATIPSQPKLLSNFDALTNVFVTAAALIKSMNHNGSDWRQGSGPQSLEAHRQ